MLDDAEIDRLNREGPVPELPKARWIFDLNLGEAPSETWQRVLEVIRIIVTQKYNSWPDDKFWKDNLPTWLSSFMMTPEECDAAMARTPRELWNQLPWEFGSWLDAIRERDWRWWGSERYGNSARIILEVTGIPPRIDAFKQVLLAAGAQILSEDHE